MAALPGPILLGRTAGRPLSSRTPRTTDGGSFAAALRARAPQRDWGRVGDPASLLQRGATPFGSVTPRAPGPIQPIDQTSLAEYAAPAEARRWGSASCSAAALAAVLRAHGVPARVGDVVRELGAGISPQRGLLSRAALVATARRYGLAAEDRLLDYADLLRLRERGQVALLSVTDRRFPEGHWLVAVGADEQGVDVVDSSGYRLTRLGRSELLQSWHGRAVVVPAPPGGDP